MNLKDIRLEIRARNNLILAKMDERGIETVAELCRRMGKNAHQTKVGQLINMQKPALVNTKEGWQWSGTARALATFFQCEPEDIFSEPQRVRALTRRKVKAEIAFEDIKRLMLQQAPDGPAEILEQRELQRIVTTALSTLTPRQERVLRLRFGIGNDDEKTLEEIAQLLNLPTRESVRQIEAKALRCLRHPSRSRRLRKQLDSYDKSDEV